MTQLDQLQTALQPLTVEVTLSTGTKHTLRALRVGQLPKAAKLCTSIGTVLGKATKEGDKVDWYALLFKLFVEGSEDLLELLALGTGVARADIDELELDDAARLASAFIKVNEDFFVKRVLPLIPGLTKKVAETPQT